MGSESTEFEFCPTLAEMVRSQKIVGRSGRVFDQLAALSTPNNLLTLRNLVLNLKPERTLEVGLAFGGSALVFAATHRDLGHAPSGQHVCIDPFQETVWDSSALLMLEHAQLSKYVDFRPHSSALELAEMQKNNDQIGLAYIDGSHLFEDVFVDAYFVIRLLRQDGLVAFDDSTNPHVAKVIGFLRNCLHASLEEFDLTPYRSETASSIRYRLARALGKTQLTVFRKTGPCEREWNAPFCRF